jgi:hypothetical protein
VPLSRPAGDAGDADQAVAAALAAYAAGQGTEHAALTALAASRLLVPVVAVLAEAGPGGAEKETEMALPTLIGNDGRKAVIAFTSAAAIARWRPDARPVPVPAPGLWPAVAAEQADAVVIDVAGPVPLVIEGARLAALAAGGAPPAPHQDPDVHAAVAAAVDGAARAFRQPGAPGQTNAPGQPGAPSQQTGPAFTLEPGGPEADLTVTLHGTGPAAARAAAQAIAAALAPRFRRGIALRLG